MSGPSTDETGPAGADAPSPEAGPTSEDERAADEEPTSEDERAADEEPTSEDERAADEEPTSEDERSTGDEASTDDDPRSGDRPAVDDDATSGDEATAAPLPWWRRRPPRRADEPWSHLARAMAYEVLVVLVTAAAIAILAFVVLQGRFQDLYLDLRHQAPVTDRVTLLTVGPEALYLWDPATPEPTHTPRPLLAQLVRFLDAAGAEVVVLDLLLDQPAPGDDALATQAAEHGAVIGAERLVTTQPASGRQFVAGLAPSLLDAMHGGYANFQAESVTLFSDEVLVRRVPLVTRASRAHLAGSWPDNQVGGRQDIDQVVPALALVAAWLHQARTEDPAVTPDRLYRQLQERCAGVPLDCGLDAPDLGLPPIPGPLTRPLDINYRGPEHADGLPAVPAARILRILGQDALMRQLGAEPVLEVPQDLRAVLEDRVVIVGRVDAAADDRFVTPYGYPVPMGPDMAGPRIHAHIVDTLLSGRHLRPVRGLPVWLLGGLLAALVVWSHGRLRDDVLAIGWLLVAVLLVAGGALLFAWTDATSLDLGPPLLGLLGALFLVTLRGWAVEESRRT